MDNPELAQKRVEELIMGNASTTLRNTVSDIQDKFKDIQKLEVSVSQCVRLFNELSSLVFAQGLMIDNIETNVAECRDNAKGA